MHNFPMHPGVVQTETAALARVIALAITDRGYCILTNRRAATGCGSGSWAEPLSSDHESALREFATQNGWEATPGPNGVFFRPMEPICQIA